MVLFSYYPADPRPRRAAEALVREGMSVELICLRESAGDLKRERVNEVDVHRVRLRRRRGGSLGYLFQYAAFLSAVVTILALRSLSRRYDLVYVHNMPDILVLSALVPRLFGAKVILDLHDPMPELMMTIFNLVEDSPRVRLLKRLERWSIRRADLALTVNLACKKLFVSRSCDGEKMRVVMNSPDEGIFRFRPAPLEDVGGGGKTRPFVIMYHGSLVERNGLDLAVEAVARVRERGAVGAVELRVYGPVTPFLERVMEAAQARGLTDTVRYLGPKRLEEIVEAIEDCDVGVIPNHRSSFAELNTPTRIFEYLAIGKPVIAPRTAGILDYFDDDSLVFFEPGDAEDLARGIENAFADPRKLGETARRGQEIYRVHTWRREREALVGLVRGLVRGWGSRR
jgi:glycosyltransferase involved in cell wall biosynthesis